MAINMKFLYRNKEGELMYRMLIVDDESWIRERIRYTIDWQKVGIQVAGEACDGEEALKMAEELYPDIILTDIRMPCIDGLELARELKKRGNEAKVIIISGYADFEYAKKAIQLGAFDYILKPFEDEELINVISVCVKELDRLKQKEELLERAGKQIKESMLILKEKFLINLVNGYFQSEQQIYSYMEYIGLEYKGTNYICFVVQIDECGTIGPNGDWDEHLAQFAVCNIIKDFVAKIGESELFFLHTGEIICLIFSKNSSDILARQVMSISNGIRRIVRKVMDITVTIGIGRTCTTFLDISTSYREAKQALQFRTYFGADRTYNIKGLDANFRLNNIRPQVLQPLLNSIRIGDIRSALRNLDIVVKEATKDAGNLLPVDLKLLYVEIAYPMAKIILEENTLIENSLSFSLNFFERFNMLQSMDQLKKFLEDTMMVIIDCLQNSVSNKKRKVIEKALEYIENHYNEPITMNDVARKLYLNATYFCKMFKDEMGESFTKYLMRLRIQKAIEFMNDPTLKIYEIAEKVGYSDVQYFTKIFKNFHGVTPMQYREKIK